MYSILYYSMYNKNIIRYVGVRIIHRNIPKIWLVVKTTTQRQLIHPGLLILNTFINPSAFIPPPDHSNSGF